MVASESCPNYSSCVSISDCRVRKEVISLFQEKPIWSASELMSALREKGLGVSASRKCREFLTTPNSCRHVGAIRCDGDEKPLRLKKQGIMFALNTIKETEIADKMTGFLTTPQRRILRILEFYDRRSRYLSLYDLYRLLPHSTRDIDYSIDRLLNFKLVKRVTGNASEYYCRNLREEWLQTHLDEAEAEDKIEFEAITIFQRHILNLYPPGMLLRTKGIVRAASPEMMRSTGGMCFDIVYELSVPVLGKKFLPVNIYPRIPVTELVLKFFQEKIRFAGYKVPAKDKSPDANVMRAENTLGMIVYRRASPRAIHFANQNNIRLVKLSDVGIDYDKLYEKSKELI